MGYSESEGLHRHSEDSQTPFCKDEDLGMSIDRDFQSSPSRKPQSTNILIGFIVLILAVALCIQSIFLFEFSKASHRTDSSSNNYVSNDDNQLSFEVLGDCGSSYQEARDNDCLFDAMLGHWVSRPCFDDEMYDKYFKQHPWKWFHDPSLTDPVSKDDIIKGDYPGTWTSLEYHFYHCAYLWELQIGSYLTGAPITEYLWSYGHTKHCAEMMAAREYPGRNVTYLETGFQRCILPRLTGT